MGKTYYCDYCDRSFKDNVEARKKHLSSLQHSKNRTDHYNVFKDPETILREEREKTACKRYMSVGDCAFGPGCRYSHYTPPMIWELERLVAVTRTRDLMAGPAGGWPDPQDVINKYFQCEVDPGGAERLDCPVWSAPSRLPEYSYLPPSLRAVTSAAMADCSFNRWA